MALYLKATIVTFLVGALIAFGFYKWRAGTEVSEGAVRLGLIDRFERDGLPDFSGKNLEGKDVKLSDARGKLVIVSFWATWCGPCVEEIPSLIDLVQKMNGEVVLYAVSQDSSRDEVETFLKAFPGIKNKNIHVILDLDRTIGRLYNADRLPESYLANKEQKLERKIVGSIDWATPDAIAFMKRIIGK